MLWSIKLDGGDYLVESGGYDWGRGDEYAATVYQSRAEAEEVAEHLRCFGAVVVEHWSVGRQ